MNPEMSTGGPLPGTYSGGHKGKEEPLSYVAYQFTMVVSLCFHFGLGSWVSGEGTCVCVFEAAYRVHKDAPHPSIHPCPQPPVLCVDRALKGKPGDRTR